jgi:hypothetical protein
MMSADRFSSACLKAWDTLDFSMCKPLGLDASTWIAGVTALVGVLLFFGRNLIRLRRTTRQDSNHISATLGRSRFRNLCRSIVPLIDENYRIFFRFGPNSGQDDGLPKNVRFELRVWYQLREQVVENNARIKELLKGNFEAVPQEYRPIFLQWLNHIDAFRAG